MSEFGIKDFILFFRIITCEVASSQLNNMQPRGEVVS